MTRLRLRTIVLVIGAALCLIGGFLRDPHPLSGCLDKEIAAGIILTFGMVVALVGIAMVPWRRIELKARRVLLVTSLVVIWLGACAFDPTQGYRCGLNLFIDGNLGALALLSAGVGLLVCTLTLNNKVWRRRLVVAVVALCLACAIILSTRVPKHCAIERGLEYFSDLDDPTLIGAWFGIECPRGWATGFKMMSGREPSTRLVWKVTILHESLFGSVWLAPWSGEIIAVDGPEKWTR